MSVCLSLSAARWALAQAPTGDIDMSAMCDV